MPTVRNVYANIGWKGYDGKRVIYPVCVRSPAQQGRNLTASFTALSERIKEIDLVLIDTLDRYNFDGDADLCRQNGRDWLEKSMPLIERAFDVKSYTIWDDVLSDPTYIRRKEKIINAYYSNATVRDMIDRNAMYFVHAKRARGETFDEQKLFENSRDYMIEEYAGTAVYGQELGYLPEAYWGIYVGNQTFFADHTGDQSLVLPETLPISVSRLSPPFAGEQPARKLAA